MADGIKSPEGEKPQSSSGKQWDKFKEIVPERDDVVIPEGEDEKKSEGHKTLSQRMLESPNLTDAQTAIQVLLPDLIKRWLNVLQVSRIFPDTYNHFFRIFIKDLMRTDRGMTLAEAIAYVSTALSIAIDGEGRIDILGVIGRASQMEMEKDKSKSSVGL